MKFLLVAALVAVAAAYPSEERNRRSAVWGGVGPVAPGAVIQGSSAVLHGPSAILHANSGSIHTAAHVPAHTAVVGPAWHSAGLVAPHWGAWGGAVVGHHGAVIGHPGAVLLG